MRSIGLYARHFRNVGHIIVEYNLKQSGRRDLNSRPHDPQSCALTGLRHAPYYGVKIKDNLIQSQVKCCIVLIPLKGLTKKSVFK